MLADNSTDLITLLGPDLRRIYVSPASETMLGYAPHELIGLHPHELAHAEDKHTLASTMEIVSKHGHAPPVSYRARRKDGSYVWVEAIVRSLGKGNGLVFAIRDIAQRKITEARLQQANEQLERQVMLDGLTGIANRRCFDLNLQKEFRRASRAELPLALLLIDVDHFKAFNDLYGHPAGDECLRVIAIAIEQQTRRPGDLTARYGGEEFAVLLPETESAGAMQLAERVRNAVRLLSIKHSGNPQQFATISIGVAVVWPPSPAVNASDLVQQADTALYQAKSLGRDQVFLRSVAPEIINIEGERRV